MSGQQYWNIGKWMIGYAVVALYLIRPATSIALPVALASLEHNHSGATALLDLNPGVAFDTQPFNGSNNLINPVRGSCSAATATQESCSFFDTVNAPANFLHWEMQVTNAGSSPVAFNYNMTSLGRTVVSGVLSLGAQSSALFEVFINESQERSSWAWSVNSSSTLATIGVDTSVVEFSATPPLHELCYQVTGCSSGGGETVGPGLARGTSVFLDPLYFRLDPGINPAFAFNPVFFSDPAHDCFAPADPQGGPPDFSSCPALDPVYLSDLLNNLGNLPTFSTTLQEFPDVPEPGTFVLAVSGLVGLGFWRWRTRRQAV